MEEEEGIQDALEPEGEQQPDAEIESDDVSEKLTKAEQKAENQKIRAEKAEAEVKKLKATQQQITEITPPPNAPDYTKYSEKIDRLTLKSEGITHADDVKVVLAEAKRLQLPVDEVAGMEHIQAKLKNAQAQRDAEAGMPTGKGRSSGANKTSVDYWVGKKKADGTFETPDNLELADKVIEARIKQHADNSKFSDDLYSG